MPISGIVIKCPPGRETVVAEQARLLAGVEVHGVLPDGQVVAVIEAATVDQEAKLAMQLQGIAGVLNVQVAYHNFEDVTPEQDQGGAYATDKA